MRQTNPNPQTCLTVAVQLGNYIWWRAVQAPA